MHLVSYQKELERVLVNLREKCHLDVTTVDSEEWELFQNALRLVQICGEIRLHSSEVVNGLKCDIEFFFFKYRYLFCL